MLNVFKFVLKGFKLKKLGVEPKNGSTSCAHPVDHQSRAAKKFLSLLVAFSSRSRSGRGPVEVRLRPTVTCQAFNANG